MEGAGTCSRSPEFLVIEPGSLDHFTTEFPVGMGRGREECDCWLMWGREEGTDRNSISEKRGQRYSGSEDARSYLAQGESNRFGS